MRNETQLKISAEVWKRAFWYTFKPSEIQKLQGTKLVFLQSFTNCGLPSSASGKNDERPWLQKESQTSNLMDSNQKHYHLSHLLSSLRSFRTSKNLFSNTLGVINEIRLKNHAHVTLKDSKFMLVEVNWSLFYLWWNKLTLMAYYITITTTWYSR